MRRRYSLEECRALAATCTERGEFRRRYPYHYAKAVRSGELAAMTAHIPERKWTKEACAAVAKRFTSRVDFWKNEPSCYSQMHRGGWAAELCAHMEYKTAKRMRWIYAIKSSDERVAYVGLTWNVSQRLKGHRAGGRRVANLLSAPHSVEVVSGPHAVNIAGEAEKEAIAQFLAAGWTLLNAARPGALGARPLKWTKAACKREALKYSTRGQFSVGNHSAYAAACDRGWIDDISQHMEWRRLRSGYWSKERCAEAARQCLTRREFRVRFDIARQIAQRNGWMDDICAHMNIEKRGNGYWTVERCAAEAKNYVRRGAFALGCPAAYDAAWKRGWLDDICAHMESSKAAA